MLVLAGTHGPPIGCSQHQSVGHHERTACYGSTLRALFGLVVTLNRTRMVRLLDHGSKWRANSRSGVLVLGMHRARTRIRANLASNRVFY
ncbi:hypothetical protein A0W34_31630 (plasmid) [Rhodococcus sp. BH4]|nr:hypothetical protein A0W34_31630 [Rhodococcus sp. BH4]OMQ29495.1 hypothetical protein BK799_25885 [Rhodococcus sp. D-1]